MRNLFLLTLLLISPLTTWAKVNVVGTLPVFATLAQEIGGDRVIVSTIARANQDPHFLDAKPTYVVAISQADLLIYGGLDLEIGWLPPLILQARNPKIQTNASGDLNASQGLNILEMPSSVDRALGDVHPHGNPHSWLDPKNAKLIAANIYKHLVAIDPAGEAEYKQHLETFVQKLNAVLDVHQADIKALNGFKVITYHKSLSYFASWTGLDIVGTIEPKPGIPPNSKHVEELVDQIKHDNVKAILAEDFYPTKESQYLAEKTGVPFIVISNTTGEKSIDTYEALIDQLFDKIKKAI